MMYHIVGNFEGEKFRRFLTFAAPKNAMTPNFAEKTFKNSHKTVKFVKVFSLKSFPLYGNHTEHVHECLMVHDTPETSI